MVGTFDVVAETKVNSLTHRECELVFGLLSGLSNAEAMRAAGYSESYVRTRSGAVCGKDKILLTVRAAMEAAGIGAVELAALIHAGLSAVTPSGQPDHNTRHKFGDRAPGGRI
jgi:DNA-binding CsgD family transcriptional regulator